MPYHNVDVIFLDSRIYAAESTAEIQSLIWWMDKCAVMWLWVSRQQQQQNDAIYLQSHLGTSLLFILPICMYETPREYKQRCINYIDIVLPKLLLPLASCHLLLSHWADSWSLTQEAHVLFSTYRTLLLQLFLQYRRVLPQCVKLCILHIGYPFFFTILI